MRMIALLLMLSACKLETSTRSNPFDVGDFVRIDIADANGDVTVRAGAAPNVEAVLTWRGDVEPDLSTRIAGDTLLVFAECPEDSKKCRIDLDIVVPDITDVDLSSTGGAVVIDGVAGVIDLDIGEGDVTLIDVVGNTRVDVELGALALDHVEGRVDLSVTEGDVTGSALSSPTFDLRGEQNDIDVTFETQPDIVDIFTDKGDMTLRVPEGEYQIDADAPRGQLSVLGVVNTVDAGSLVRLHTGKGDITVDGL